MSGVSPSSVLFGSDGTELAVLNNTTVVSAAQRAILTAAVNPNNKTDFLQMTLAGGLGISSYSNNVPVQTAATVTTSGSFTTNVSTLFGTQEVALVVNVGTVTGAGSIQYTVQEVDPGDNVTLYGNSASTPVITTGNAPGVFTAVLNTTTATSVTVTWTVTGTFSATIYSTLTTKETPSTQTINGTVTSTNNSVGSDGSAALAFDTQVGGKVTTAAPTYTNGNLNALSLTTLGGLRIDGVYATGTATGTAADAIVSGGYVTTAAPTYTTGQLNALSLDTSGNLRTSVNNTVTVTGTVTANQGTSPWIVAGGGTAGTPATGVITVQGITGMTPIQVTTNKATTSSVTSVAVTANANNALLAPNANRQFSSVFNNTNKTLYIKCGATASTSSFTTQLFSGSYWEAPVDWTGELDAFAPAAASGSILVTELTP